MSVPTVEVEPTLSPEEIAKLWKCDPWNVRKIFANEPGVINISTGKKNKTIRIPVSVYKLVCRKRQVA